MILVRFRTESVAILINCLLQAKYVVSKDLGGSMIWHIGGDDVSGDCGRKQNLLKAINEEMSKASSK